MHTGTESPDQNNKKYANLCLPTNLGRFAVFDCSFPVALSKDQPIHSFCIYYILIFHDGL